MAASPDRPPPRLAGARWRVGDVRGRRPGPPHGHRFLRPDLNRIHALGIHVAGCDPRGLPATHGITAGLAVTLGAGIGCDDADTGTAGTTEPRRIGGHAHRNGGGDEPVG